MKRTFEEFRARAKAMGLSNADYAEYRDRLQDDYAQLAFSTSRLLSRLVMAGGWPW